MVEARRSTPVACSVQVDQGTKLDMGKNRYDLLPFDVLDQWVQVLTFGTQKYADRDWERGMPPGRNIAAALRHISSFMQGEDWDSESRLHHLAHALCDIGFALRHTQSHPQLDDRSGYVLALAAKKHPWPVETTFSSL